MMHPDVPAATIPVDPYRSEACMRIVDDRQKLLKAAFILIFACGLCLGAALVFYPKERVIGGLRGGPIGPGAAEYREDYQCFGMSYDFCPAWPDYGCDYQCYGLLYDRVCSIETYETEQGVTRVPTNCRETP
jgi:hypothetical protein